MSPPEDLRGQPLERRIEKSKKWAAWAPGLMGTLTQWPLIVSHIGERHLRAQLHLLGWPVGRILRFGATAFALRTS